MGGIGKLAYQFTADLESESSNWARTIARGTNLGGAF
jgi:hypothetical protein